MGKYEKQEKILWYVQILIFAAAIYIYYDMQTGGNLGQVILAVISVLSLTVDRFYYSKKIGQDVYFSYSIAYGLIVLFCLMLVLAYVGVFHLGILDTSGKLLWVMTPAFALLWKTKFIAFREWK